MENRKQKLAELEALLFHYGEPVELKKISKILNLKENEVADLVNSYEGQGLMILRQGERVQLVTKPEHKGIAEELIKEEFREELTPASLETLAIVAYLGPVPRSTIDFVRGVNSSFVLRSLLMRGLIERELNPHRQNVYDYRVSFDFLRHMGLGSQSELPGYEKYKDIYKDIIEGFTNEKRSDLQN